eukprot:s4207_g1.t3
MLHGDMQQRDRDWAMERFREGDLPCVISTGVLARGHDIPKVRFVFNYDVPREAEDYIHRVGRTGRAGAKGYAMIFVDKAKQKEIESAHAFLMGVLKATDQTVEEDFKEAVESYEKSQNQTWDDGAVWDGWDEEDTKHEGGTAEDAYTVYTPAEAQTESASFWESSSVCFCAAWGTAQEWPEGTQNTEWQGTTEDAYTAYTPAEGGTTEGADTAAEAQAEAQQEAPVHPVQAAAGDAAQQKGGTTEGADTVAEAQAEAPQESREAAAGDAAQQKAEAQQQAPVLDQAAGEDAAQQEAEAQQEAPVLDQEHWPEGAQGTQWQENWSWPADTQGHAWQASHWHASQSEHQWYQETYGVQWPEGQAQWQVGQAVQQRAAAVEEQTVSQDHVETYEISAPPFPLTENDAVKKQKNATVGQESEEPDHARDWGIVDQGSRLLGKMQGYVQGHTPLETQRVCTDCLFIPLFVAAVLGFFLCISEAVEKGSFQRLTSLPDFEGNLCGTNGQGPYLYFCREQGIGDLVQRNFGS